MHTLGLTFDCKNSNIINNEKELNKMDDTRLSITSQQRFIN